LTKLVTGMIPELPGMPAWRFVPQDYVFPDPLNPFAEAFPELIEIPSLSSDWLDANFVAIKVGDVNCSAVPNALVASEDRTFGEAPMYGQWQMAADGRSCRMPLYLDLPDGLSALQFTLEFDAGQLSFAGIEPAALTIEPWQINRRDAADGRISLAWYDAAGRHLPKGEPICYVVWEVHQPTAELQPEIRLTDALAQKAAYDLAGREYVPVWRGVAVPAADEASGWLELLANPVRDRLEFRFSAARGGTVHLQLTDLNGRPVWTADERVDEGIHERTIGLPANVTSGVYVLVLETEGGRYTRRVVVLD
ncbi:MAG: T9SS C-terminal target domain-containing protein, partial [Bacteroidetes bacterium]